MCGRFTLRQDHFENFLDDMGLKHPEFRVPSRYNIAPTAPVQVIRVKGSDEDQAILSISSLEKEATIMRWGLVPHWAKELWVDKPLFNARSETVAGKPAFRSPFRRRKCLIPASGYYEWRKEGTSKVPYYISVGGEGAFAFAGLWEIWMGPHGDDWLETVTIVTKKAGRSTEHIHHRSPIIISPDDYDLWLTPQDPPDRKIFTKLNSDIDNNLTIYEVSPFVSNTRNDGEDCIKPAQKDQFSFF